MEIILEYCVKLPNVQKVVDKALNGQNALSKVMTNVERFGTCSYEFILMDCNMPEMDGYMAT